jgi:SAM-dependent methyltransferase
MHPLTEGLDPDEPKNLPCFVQTIQKKRSLYRIYREWYGLIINALPQGSGSVLEIGSGPGFLKELLPEVITSDVFSTPLVQMVLDGHALPLRRRSLRAIVMVNVLHHLTTPRLFLAEAGRCCRQNGVVVLIEPWITSWSHRVYSRWHHEPCDPKASSWEFPPRGPLSGANQAMPWIIFHRDRSQFKREYPEWEIEEVRLLMPFRYLFSGGLSMRALVPAWSFGLLQILEHGLNPWIDSWAMFAKIVLRRTNHSV